MKTLGDWLHYVEQVHPENIELGLNRVKAVYSALPGDSSAATVFTVAGTNGKGTTVECLTRCLLAQGLTVGTYTSPHLVRFNERICVNGIAVSDALIMDALAIVEQSRASTELTYFEFTTLAALQIFRMQQVDVWVLEVGLGGRLDAVNIIDADIALITAIGLDHKEWLGDSREQIALEKAGIMRADKRAICSDPNPPLAISRFARSCGAHLVQLGKQFTYKIDRHVAGKNNEQYWSWSGTTERRPHLLQPSGVVLDNIAGALAALEAANALPTTDVLNQIFKSWSLPGRQQRVAGVVDWWLDVAHNMESVAWLTKSLAEHPCMGRTYLVVGMLADKPVAQVLEELASCATHWIVVGLDSPRAVPAFELAAVLTKIRQPHTGRFVVDENAVVVVNSVAAGCAVACARAQPGDRVVVTGSFHSVGPALAWLAI